MRPELVLKLSAGENPREKLNEWLREYSKYENDSSCAELVSMLRARARQACRLLEENEPGDCPELDGDFPLGNTEDAEFISRFFEPCDLVKIQLGNAYKINVKNRMNPDLDDRARQGILSELQEDWQTASLCYASHPSDVVAERGRRCVQTARELYLEHMKRVKDLIGEGRWEDAWYPLSEAVDWEFSMDTPTKHPPCLATCGRTERVAAKI